MNTTGGELAPDGQEEENVPEGRPLNEISAGEKDDTTGETIIYVVYSTKDFIVTIDKKLSLNWETSDGFDRYATDFGEIISSVELSDALVDRVFADWNTQLAYKKMLGSVIGRLLDDGESSSARKQLTIVDERINAHGRERMRMSYINFALLSVVCIAIAFLLTRVFKLDTSLSPDNLYLVWCVMLGGIGAFITTFARFQRYQGDLVAGVGIHRLDGFLRIFYGLIAGLIIFYAVKANVLIGFGNDSKNSQPWLYYFLAMVAGASEVLIPNLIKQSEGELGIKRLEKKEKEMEDDASAGGGADDKAKAAAAAAADKTKAAAEAAAATAEKEKAAAADKEKAAAAATEKEAKAKKEAEAAAEKEKAAADAAAAATDTPAD